MEAAPTAPRPKRSRIGVDCRGRVLPGLLARRRTLVVLTEPVPEIERELIHPAGGEPRGAHAEETDPLARIDAGQQRRGHLPDGPARGDGSLHGVRPRQQRQVLELDLDRDRPRRARRAAQHGCNRLGHPQHVALELVRIDEVLAEGLLVPDRLVGPVRVDRIGVLAAGQRRQVGAARLAESTHHRVEGQAPPGLPRCARRDRAGAWPWPDRRPTVPRPHGRAGTRARRPAPPGTRPGRARARPGWPAAWPPARRAWRSFWSVRCPPRTRDAARRAPGDAVRARCVPVDRAGAPRPPRPRTPRRGRSARPWA